MARPLLDHQPAHRSRTRRRASASICGRSSSSCRPRRSRRPPDRRAPCQTRSVMYAPAANAAPANATAQTPATEVRQGVAQMLSQSEAFRDMPAKDQQEIAHNTALIADYLARPEGHPGQPHPRRSRAPPAAQRALAELPGRRRQVGGRGELGGTAQGGCRRDRRGQVQGGSAAREGANVAGMLLNEVQVPDLRLGADPGRLHARSSRARSSR